MSVQVMHSLLVSIKLDHPASRRLMGQVRRPGIWAGVS